MIKVPGFRILVKPMKLEDVDKVYQSARNSGLILADHEDTKAQRKGVDRGTVLQVGPTAFAEYGGDPWCEVGDTIVYARYAGMIVKDPATEEDFLVINDEDVVAILKEEKNG